MISVYVRNKCIVLILPCNMRIIYSVIIVSMLLLIVPGILQTDNAPYGLFAALQPEPSLPDVSSGDILVNEPEPLKGRFLVATPRLKESFFSKTVILLLHHSSRRSSGLVVNRPSHIMLSSVFPDVEEIRNSTDKIYIGGPVDLNSFLILVQSDSILPESKHLIDNLYISASIETLKYMYRRSGAGRHVRVIFGYAGWSPGQLMNEVERGSWHVVSGDTGCIFDGDADGLWDGFMKRKKSGSQSKKGLPSDGMTAE